MQSPKSSSEPDADPLCRAIARRMAAMATQMRSDLQQYEQLRHADSDGMMMSSRV